MLRSWRLLCGPLLSRTTEWTQFEMVLRQAIIVMGVTGAGKSTVGGLLAAELRCDFLDGDNFHSAENKEKMRGGMPLTDSDRMPWLETLRDTLRDYVLRGQCVVLACSALLPKYRDLLRAADSDFLRTASTPEAASISSGDTTAASNDTDSQARGKRDLNSRVVFVYLKCTAELLVPRVVAREMTGTHYMPASLLQSQIDSLRIEKSEGDIFETDASLSPPVIVQHIRTQLAV